MNRGKSPRVAVMGGGNGAFITAADLSLRGFDVSLCEAPELESNIGAVREKGGIELEVRNNLNIPSGCARLHTVTVNVGEAVKDRDVILVVVPAFAQRRFAELLAPVVSPEQIVVLTPGNFGGALEFNHIFRHLGLGQLPVLAEFECMIYSGFKGGPASAWVSGFKQGLKVGTFPGRDVTRVYDLLLRLYPDLRCADNVLETGLSNINTVVHAPILILNAGWVETTGGKFLFYWDGCTESVSAVVEGVDDERLAIGRALGLNLTPSIDILRSWYGHQGAGGATLGEVLRTNPAYEWDTAPGQLAHRFLLEDIPYGMVPIETLGELLNVPTTTISAVIDLSCALLRRDLRTGARDLKRLGLEGMNGPAITKFMRDGA